MKPCCRCKKAPRSKHHNYCSPCRTEYMREWRSKHPHYFAEVARQKRKRIPTYNAHMCRRHYARHPEDYLHYNRMRKARLRGAAGHCSVPQWLAKLAYYGHRCVYCGCTDAALTRDHKIPLSHGGSNWPANLVPACMRCNISKGQRSFLQFLLYRRSYPVGIDKLVIAPSAGGLVS